MAWNVFFRHNRWQKITALLLATLIWFTVDRKLQHGGGVRLTLDGSTRQFERVPIRLLISHGTAERYETVPELATVTVRGDPGGLNRLRRMDLEVFASVDSIPSGGEVRQRIRVVLPGYEIVRVVPEEVLIRHPVQNEGPTH